jgi:hypothetical protein
MRDIVAVGIARKSTGDTGGSGLQLYSLGKRGFFVWFGLIERRRA